MKILLLTSGGDAPGMNGLLHYLTKNLQTKHQVFASMYGFQGLLDDNIIKLTTKQTKKHTNKAGSFIKCSRCLEFKEPKGHNKAIQTLEKNKIDLTIVIGGDGTFKGAQSLAEKDKNVIYLPATIDKDLHFQTYTLGFDTAVSACCNYIKNVKQTMKAFDRICVYEIMGRKNSALTNCVGKKVGADLIITGENKNKLNFDNVLAKHKANPALTVVLQENLMPLSHIENLLASKTNGGVRSCVIGYVQRGTNPTKQELKMAKQFAKHASWLVKSKKFNVGVLINDKVRKNVKLI